MLRKRPSLPQSYVSYIVKTRSRHPSYRSEQTEVVRRFRDFTWLQHRLRKAYSGELRLWRAWLPPARS